MAVAEREGFVACVRERSVIRRERGEERRQSEERVRETERERQSRQEQAQVAAAGRGRDPA